MKTSLKFNLLQHLRRKQSEGGFTLIELLVVIIIIGILAAIALPSFLNQASRARETEAKTNLGAINRAQQAFLTEEGEFAGPDTTAKDGEEELKGLGVLDVGIGDASDGTVETQYYLYKLLEPAGDPVAAAATADASGVTEEEPDKKIRSFKGCIDIDGGTEILESARGDGKDASKPPETECFKDA